MKNGIELSAKIYALIYSIIIFDTAFAYALLVKAKNSDMHDFLTWYQYILSHGRFAAFADNFSNYTPPYLYLLSIGTLADGWLSPPVIIKIISILGAIFLACCCHVLLRQFIRPQNALVAALLLLLLPSVAINSAVWGQCDAFYTGFIVLAVAFSLQRKDLLTAAMLGAAFAFKLQAVFIAPFGLFLLLARIIRPRSLLISAATCCLLMFPAWLAGRPIMDLAGIYLGQADYYRNLSMNAPNIWTYIEYFDLVPYEIGAKLGIAATALVVLAIAVVSNTRRLTSRFDLMLIALLSSIAVPYFLPKMHERYFFMADILSFLLACTIRSTPTVATALLVGTGTLFASTGYLFQFAVGPAIGGLFVTAALILVTAMFIARAFPRSAEWMPAKWLLSHIEQEASPTGT